MTATGSARSLPRSCSPTSCMQRIERAAAAVDRTGDQLALISAAVEFTAVADIELAVGAQRVSLPAGPKLVDHRHRRHRGRGARGPDRPDHPRRDRARCSGQTRCGTTRTGRSTGRRRCRRPGGGTIASTSAAANCSSSRDQLSATLSGLCGDEDSRPNARAAGASCAPANRPRPISSADVDHRACRTRCRGDRSGRRRSRMRDPSSDRGERRLPARRDIHPGNGFAEQSGDSASRTRQGHRRNWPQERRRSVTRTWRRRPKPGCRRRKPREQRAAELADELAAAAPDAVAAELAEATEAAESLRDRYEDGCRCAARGQYRALGLRQ